MKSNLSQSDVSGLAVPYAWIYCFNGQCPKSGSCLRFLTGQAVSDDVTSGQAVFPNAVNDGDCRYYHQARKIKAAWGFSKLFDSVKAADEKLLRAGMVRILKGNTNYYRYHHGKKQLTPEQQEAIKRLFAQYGYDTNLKFDGYSEIVDFG